MIGSAHGINNLANPIILIKAKGNLISSDFQSIELKLSSINYNNKKGFMLICCVDSVWENDGE